jgi:ubiquinone/menaquinone biosynthesis C-methylase UbiE
MPLHPLLISRRVEVKLIRRFLHFRPGDLVCDIGCGDGYWTGRVAKGRLAVGIDIDNRALRIANARNHGSRTEYVRTSVTALPFPSDRFDKIFGICSIEHVPENTAAFAEMARCLKPGGELALTLDSLSYPGTTEAQKEEHHRKYFTPHLYDVGYATKCLETVGLTLVAHQYIICSSTAHRIYRIIDRHPRLQYIAFPILYPLMLWGDWRVEQAKGGWKLAIKAVKKV